MVSEHHGVIRPYRKELQMKSDQYPIEVLRASLRVDAGIWPLVGDQLIRMAERGDLDEWLRLEEATSDGSVEVSRAWRDAWATAMRKHFNPVEGNGDVITGEELCDPVWAATVWLDLP